MWIERGWLDEIDHDPEGHDPIQAAGRLTMPMLVVHGEGDTTVPIGCARRIVKAAGGPCELLIIPGASHTFDAANPLPPGDPPEATRQLAQATVDFARRVIQEKTHS